MSLVPVGHAIRFSEFQSHLKGCFSLSIIKFVFTPLIIAGLSVLFLDDLVMRNTMIILAFTPTAINAVITVRLHNLNIAMVMTNFVVTTLIYLLIIYPVLFIFLNSY